MTEKEKDIKVGLLVAGIILLSLCGLLFVLVDDMSVRKMIGVIIIGVTGLGCCLAGTPDPEKKEN